MKVICENKDCPIIDCYHSESHECDIEKCNCTLIPCAMLNKHYLCVQMLKDKQIKELDRIFNI